MSAGPELGADKCRQLRERLASLQRALELIIQCIPLAQATVALRDPQADQTRLLDRAYCTRRQAELMPTNPSASDAYHVLHDNLQEKVDLEEDIRLTQESLTLEGC